MKKKPLKKQNQLVLIIITHSPLIASQEALAYQTSLLCLSLGLYYNEHHYVQIKTENNLYTFNCNS